MAKIRYAEKIPQQPVTYSGLTTVVPSLNTNVPTLDTLSGGTSGLNTLAGGTSGGQTLSGGGGVDNSSLLEMQRRAAEQQRLAEIRRAREKAWIDANKVRYENTKNKRNEIMASRGVGGSPVWGGIPYTGPSNPNVWGGIPGSRTSDTTSRRPRGWSNVGDIPKSWLNNKLSLQNVQKNWPNWRDIPKNWLNKQLETPTLADEGGGGGGAGGWGGGGYSYPSYSGGSGYNPYSWYFSLLNWRI